MRIHQQRFWLFRYFLVPETLRVARYDINTTINYNLL